MPKGIPVAGKRESGAGRPSTLPSGAKRYTVWLTRDEYTKLKEMLSYLREQSPLISEAD